MDDEDLGPEGKRERAQSTDEAPVAVKKGMFKARRPPSDSASDRNASTLESSAPPVASNEAQPSSESAAADSGDITAAQGTLNPTAAGFAAENSPPMANEMPSGELPPDIGSAVSGSPQSQLDSGQASPNSATTTSDPASPTREGRTPASPFPAPANSSQSEDSASGSVSQEPSRPPPPSPRGASGTSARLAEDGPSREDLLGFADYARAIASFLTHPDSTPPLTISVQAPWGGGKTSLMLMIEKELDPDKTLARGVIKEMREPAAQPSRQTSPGGLMERLEQAWRAALAWPVPASKTGKSADPNHGLTVAEVEAELTGKLANHDDPGLPPIPKHTPGTNHRVTVWFNAWKYESTNQVWAGLVDAILQQVPERLTRKEQERFWFRLNLSRVGGARVRQRLHEHLFELMFRTSLGLGRAAVAAATVAVLCGVLYLFPSVDSPLRSLFGWAIPTSAVAAFAAVKALAAKMKFDDAPVSEVVKNLVEAPKYEQELGFVHQVEKDLKRVFESLPHDEGLVIFIDDLDRCSPSKVASVLEAVNLFLAGGFSNCCFVVGMDTEMVAAALQSAHKELAANLPADVRIPIGWRFMDKFVQLPFVIPPLDALRYKAFMMQLLGNTESKTPGADGAAGSSAEPGIEDFNQEAARLGALRSDTPEFVNLTVEAASIFGGNPRELKRFINLLRFNYFLWFSRDRRGLAVPPKRALGLWTALSVKWPEHARWLRRIEHRRLSDETLKAMFEGPEPTGGGSQAAPVRGRLPDTGETNHLAVLESVAGTCAEARDRDRWQTKLVELYGLEKTTPWLADDALLDFYVQSGAKLAQEGRLSEHVGTGFW
ncbi:KAP-like P-loop domain-containing protein [Paraburkholderia sp. BL8N3]|nr:P-loop NTPase fold protein [Paraburkholderia sp. BL8N3]TCK36875.1 KAP-like P-loop domain-containing protein [Paraburkholderia sp. BL8N3]